MPSFGHGVDLVHIPAFSRQLEEPGTAFLKAFSPAELRWCEKRSALTRMPLAHHIAPRWAGKEAFIKAWSSTGVAPVMDQVDWAEIEVLSDAFGRPVLSLSGQVARACGPCELVISLSHDGDYAMASVMLFR